MHIKFTLLTTSLFLLIPQAQATTWSYNPTSWNKNAPEVLVYRQSIDDEQARFDDIKYDDLRRAVDLNGKQEKYFYSDRSTEDDEFFYWVTDGRTMLWRGQRVMNPPTTPTIDIASFRAYNRFAVDKYSIYFDGKRVASNLGSSHVDLTTLRMNAGRNVTTLADNNTLYLKGQPQGFGSAHNVEWLGEKSWDACGQIAANLENKPSDILIRFANHIYLNGEPLSADANSFQVMRWIPNSLLIYRDKNGTTRHIFGGRKGKTVDCEGPFIVGETDVRWKKTGRSEEQAEVLPGVDPEHFRLLTDNVAQYRDRLYVDKLSFFGEKQLETITLDSPDLVINSRLSAGISHGYFIRQFGDVQVFTPAGTLHIRSDEPDYDDRYVYTWSRSQLYRHASGCPQESRFDTDAEGDSKLTLVDQCLKNSAQDGL
ncbi:DKNYY family protein [Klebsiella spallanzanii]|uniref:DKNYY family protein n=1 Tax=Klebsiella spallanzanii TaxID=2587528 RepID=UPI00115B47FB|nr:DKNYY family protein [Klebsiella spallanzanii]VUS37347.1 hypothetical protein SB6419_02594 [Klebsiella spallanzanii]